MQAVLQYKKPEIAKDLKSFLGMINFYRPFIPHAAEDQMVLQALIDGNKKNDKTSILWTDDASIAFEKCKNDLANATLLAFPAREAEFSLVVDASDKSAGCVLHQTIDGVIQPLGFFFQRNLLTLS